MALLARAPLPLLERGLSEFLDIPLHWLRRPETGLMMVQGRAAGTGERFNLGEITVTRCALRLGAAEQQTKAGVAYLVGRDQRRAQLAAIADSLLQDQRWHQRIHDGLLTPVQQHLSQLQASRQQRAQSTKVDFVTVAREAQGSQLQQ
jgi:alpha-D-ribose 1-methylphosphonate 5-triphosphate synthase subunit PhnG